MKVDNEVKNYLILIKRILYKNGWVYQGQQTVKYQFVLLYKSLSRKQIKLNKT